MRETKFHCMSHAMAITAFKVGQEIVFYTKFGPEAERKEKEMH